MRLPLELASILGVSWGVGSLLGLFGAPMDWGTVRKLEELERLRAQPHVELSEPEGGLDRAVFGSGGCQTSIARQSQDRVGKVTHIHFVERNGTPGRQPGGDGSANLDADNSRRRQSRRVLSRSYRFGSKASYSSRRQLQIELEFAASRAVPGEPVTVRHLLGPGIRLGDGVSAWTPLWHRLGGGPRLDWRERGEWLELRARPPKGQTLRKLLVQPRVGGELSREAGEIRFKLPTAQFGGKQPRNLSAAISGYSLGGNKQDYAIQLQLSSR